MRDPDPALPAPTAARPLLGLTVLVVEDSRFASEAIRLLCLRSGARIRRADCLASARRHLQVYRPNVAIIDVGLPDGSGVDLISALAGETKQVEVILGLSGDDGAEAEARAAGVDGFLLKPVESLGVFQDAILRHMPAARRPSGPRVVSSERVEPDRLALRDDMAHAAELLTERGDGPSVDYIAQFLGGLARTARDPDLAQAAGDLAQSSRTGQAVGKMLERVTTIVRARLAEPAPL